MTRKRTSAAAAHAALVAAMKERVLAAIDRKFGGDREAARVALQAGFNEAVRKVEREMETRREARKRDGCCDGCGRSLDRRRREHVRLGPIVHGHIWRQLAEPREALCDECMHERALVRLGRMLTLSDLRPCRWNVSGQPFSWFDLFSSVGRAPPSNIEEWRAVGAPGEFEPVNPRMPEREP